MDVTPGTPSGRLEGDVAVITGAAAGLGRATSALFAEQGASVVCVDLDAKGAEAVADGLRQAGYDAMALGCDVSVESEVASMAARALAWRGHVDVLHNNAGTAAHGLIDQLDEREWDRCMDVNVKSVYLCCKYLVPSMILRGRGSVVNTASIHALFGQPRLGALGASKGAVYALTKHLAVDYGPSVRVNSVSPGPILTALVRHGIGLSPDPVSLERQIAEDNGIMRRWPEPREIANAVLFLASEEASWVTGQDLVVDGGRSASA